MKRLTRKSFLRDDKAATMVEFSLVAPFLFLLTFGIAEFAAIFFQFQTLHMATAVAARMASTRGPLITGFPDCGVGTSVPIGAFCSTVATSKTWTPLTCTGSANAPTPATSGTSCNTALMARILQEAQLVYPAMQSSNLSVAYGPSGLGFSGAGKPVPIVTVTVSGINANFIALGAVGFSGVALPPFTTSVVAEDLSGL